MTFPAPIAFNWILSKLTGPRPKFKKGDAVQCVTSSDHDLMVVQWARILKRSIVMYSCKWYDSKAKSTRTNIFREEQLKQFDWYHPEGS